MATKEELFKTAVYENLNSAMANGYKYMVISYATDRVARDMAVCTTILEDFNKAVEDLNPLIEAWRKEQVN